jgi:hypothetical protein
VDDEISDLEESLDREAKAEHFAQLAEEALPGSARRVAMLAVAGDHWQLRGDAGRYVEVARVTGTDAFLATQPFNLRLAPSELLG